jgi:hypothetical protein
VPRKRRQPKRRQPLPTGLAEISLCERALWSSTGPLIESPDIELDSEVFAGNPPLYHLWSSVDEWAAFYASVRDELYLNRPWLRDRSAAERLYTKHAGEQLAS